ncbi:MAG: DEAD/DEAH box helicase [Caldilineaceae bacterium]
MSTQFARLQLHPELVQTVASLGYSEPTPIQAAVIPLILKELDVIGQAKTGTGKTAAFALPVLNNLLLGGDFVQCLVMAPTRELAVQVARAFSDYSRDLDVSVLAVYGGQPYAPQIRQLNRGVDIVVGTPGRLLDLIKRKSLDLSQVRTVVLDEADEMLSMGFIEDIEAILAATPPTRQTALFSATISREVRRLADSYLHKPQFISVAGEDVTVAAIEQRHYLVDADDKVAAITRLLEMEETERAIVFVRTRVDSGRVADMLTARGFPAEALNGDMNQDARTRTLNRFRHADLRVLVATDVAARGLDIDDISHVINYDLPTDPEVYVHRIGRTGRAGRTGVAVSLVTRSQLRQLSRIEQTIRQSIPRATLPTPEEIEARRAAEWQKSWPSGCAGDDSARSALWSARWWRRFRAAGHRCGRAQAGREDGRAPVESIKDVSARRPRANGGGPREHRAAHTGGRDRSHQRPAPARPTRPAWCVCALNTGKSDGVRPNGVVATVGLSRQCAGQHHRQNSDSTGAYAGGRARAVRVAGAGTGRRPPHPAAKRGRGAGVLQAKKRARSRHRAWPVSHCPVTSSITTSAGEALG